MQVRSLFALLAVALGSSAIAQNTLSIGDPAPAFKVEGWIKGDKLEKLETGKVYVIEFWATWCGPCIASMPHLSEMAEKYKDKATFISINSWDYKTQAGPEATTVHQQRVKDWVAGNDKNMRYNIAFDDAKDTMANTWMRPAGQNGIPCAMIVNEEGKIAWIGHPMMMDSEEAGSPLTNIVAHKWDVAAEKAKFDKAAADEKVAAEKNQKLVAAAKAGDLAKFEELMGTDYSAGLNGALMGNPDFGVTILEKYADKTKYQLTQFMSMTAYIAERTKSDDVKARALKFATARSEKLDEPIGMVYYARTLFFAGQKDEAVKWADKALSKLDSVKDADERAQMKKFIDSQKETFTKPSGGGSGGR